MSATNANEVGRRDEVVEDSSQAQGSDRSSVDMERQNIAVVQDTYAAVGRGDIPAVLTLLTDDVEWSLQGPAVIPFAGTRFGTSCDNGG